MRLRSCHSVDILANGNAGRERLLAEDVLVGLNGSDGLRCVLCGDASNHDSLKAWVLQKLLVIAVELAPEWLEALLRPCESLLIGVECSYKICSGSAVEEVKSMASAHAA